MTATNQDIGTDPRRPFMSGDSRTIDVPVDDQDGADFLLEDATTIRWEVFASNGDAFSGSALVQKSLDSGIEIVLPAMVRIRLLPDDTKALAGIYYHEAELIMANGDVHTFMKGRFQITADAIE